MPGGSMEVGSWSRNMKDHIFNYRCEAERTNSLEVGHGYKLSKPTSTSRKTSPHKGSIISSKKQLYQGPNAQIPLPGGDISHLNLDS